MSPLASLRAAAHVCLLCLAGSLAVASCESPSSPSADACSLGASASCTGPGGCAGTRVCTGAPARYGDCGCDKKIAADAGVHDRLGAACKRDTDCPAGAACLAPGGTRLFGGAPPEGTCVADCTRGASACARFADTVCVDVSGTNAQAARGAAALCFEACSFGAGVKDKCHGRERVACAPVDSEPNGGAFCRPLCASDAECGGGACDPARGVCVASAAPDRGFGLRCGPDSGRSDQDAGYELDGGANEQPVLMCGGLCVQLNHAPHVCSRACVFGTTAECAPASGGLRRGGCVFASEQGNIGDIGYCGELCDCNADCSDPSFVCDAFEDAKLEGAYGRKGVCTEPTLLLHAAIECAK